MIILRSKSAPMKEATKLAEGEYCIVSIGEFSHLIGSRSKISRCYYVLGNDCVQVKFGKGVCGFKNGRFEVITAPGNAVLSFKQKELEIIEQNPDNVWSYKISVGDGGGKSEYLYIAI